MINYKIAHLNNEMQSAGIQQLLISDAFHIEYYTGRHFYAGERFLGMIVSRWSEPILIVPELTSAEGIPGFEVVKLRDSDDPAQVISRYINHEWALGVDGALPSSVLLCLMKQAAASSYEDVSALLCRVRSVKSPEEIQRMKKASAINDMAMNELKKGLQEGITELEVQQELARQYEAYGYDGQYFGIISFGKNTADPHHIPDDTKLKPGDTVLFDIGCRVNGYWSDMTRTYFYRSVSERAMEMYEIVRLANDVGEATIQPGVPLERIDEAARTVIDRAGYGKHFTHRLGHQIGIEVHECADVRQGVKEAAQSGMIFSCEPGIYLPEEGIGIRIEDLCLVTEQGVEILNHVPKTLEVLD